MLYINSEDEKSKILLKQKIKLFMIDYGAYHSGYGEED